MLTKSDRLEDKHLSYLWSCEKTVDVPIRRR